MSVVSRRVADGGLMSLIAIFCMVFVTVQPRTLMADIKVAPFRGVSPSVSPEDDSPEKEPETESPGAEDADNDEEVKDDANEEKESPSQKSKPATTSRSAKKDKDEDKSNAAQVEVYIPSVTALVNGFETSRTGKLCDAFSAMIPKFERETEDEFDVSAVFSLLEKISAWPDTSIGLTTYTLDQEGRSRWAARFDWPLDELKDRLRELIDDDAAKKLFNDLKLTEQDDGTCRLELPDMVLAVLRKYGKGSLLTSTADLDPPEILFGQKKGERAAKKGGSLIYCRLNLDAGDEDEKANGFFGQLSMISGIRYAASVDKDGQWRERFNVRWNPLLGLGIKTVLKKTTGSYECPKDAYAAGAIHLAMGEGLVDQIAGLEVGTIGTRADAEMAFVVMPGTGFFPVPDVFYQFNARRLNRIKDDIRKAIKKDTARRKDDDLPPAWKEQDVDGKVVFWHDPSADGGGGFSFATFRTVLFFEKADNTEGGKNRLIICETSTSPDDAVRRWKKLQRQPKSTRITLPDSSKTHWQIVLNWRGLYQLAQPYLSLFAASAEGAESAPRVEDLGDSLSDSVINLRMEYAGLDVRHTGPVPLGFIYVPGVTIASLASGADPSSEAERERLACQNLRVLFHHAKLFKKDYNRWPATVAELDGYVDFASHPNLLNLSPRDDGLLVGFVSMFTADKKDVAGDEIDDDDIDDTLYEIDWDESAWKLKYRDETFVKYATILIDQDGKIHRVPKSDDKKPADKPSRKQKKELVHR